MVGVGEAVALALLVMLTAAVMGALVPTGVGITLMVLL
jgi:hypothetical protein